MPPQSTLESILTSSSNPTYAAMLSLAKAVLPSSFFTPSIETLVEKMAPIPSPVHPSVLKKALILLSSPETLTDVGQGSPNLLVFNNFTASVNMMENLLTQLE